MNNISNNPFTSSNTPHDRYRKILAALGSKFLKNLYHRPVFIVSAPRSGSTLLFETLSRSTDFWTLGEECHTIYKAIPSLDASIKNFDSGALTREQADVETSNLVRAGFSMYLRNHYGTRYMQLPISNRPTKIRFLEKTPRNALNIPFLNKIFPDASYIFLTRNAEPNINSIIEAWEIGLENGSFITFNNLRGWDLKNWCMLLPPGWRNLNGRSLAEIAAFQWKSSNENIIKDLQAIPGNRKACIRYEDLINNPDEEVSRLLKFSGMTACKDDAIKIENNLPLSKTTVSPPSPDKWKKRFSDIEPLLPELTETTDKINALYENQNI